MYAGHTHAFPITAYAHSNHAYAAMDYAYTQRKKADAEPMVAHERRSAGR